MTFGALCYCYQEDDNTKLIYVEVIMKKTISVFLAVLLLFGLTACGGSKVDTSDPNQGVWRATTGEMFGISSNVEEFFGKGFTIELNAKGKCALNVDGSKANGTWTLDNGAFTVKGGGLDCKGRLENGKLTLEDVLGMGLTLVFEKEGGYTVAATSTPVVNDVGYYIIDSIVQDGETYGPEELAYIGIEYYVILNADGSAEISTDNLIKGTWKPGRIDYKEEGEDVISEYTLVGDTLTIELGSADVKLIFKRSDGTPAVPGSSGTPDATGKADNPAAGLSDKLAWWDGDWYGYWTVVSGSGRYESMKGGVWDCYAIINAYDDETATVFWFDDDMFLGEVNVALSFEGYHIEIGYAESVGGTLFDDPVRDEAWYISPDNSDYDNMIEIDEWHEDLQGVTFRYKVFLRPWGMLWDDVPSDKRPPYYDWYLGVRHMTMDDALNGGGNSGGDTGGGETPGGNTGGTAAVDGRLPAAKLMEAYTAIKALDFNSQLKLDYDTVRDQYFDGIDANEISEDASFSYCEWVAFESASQYIHISFQKPNGHPSNVYIRGFDSDSGGNTGGGGTEERVVLDLTNEELSTLWNDFMASNRPWSGITYESIVELLGVEGALIETTSTNYIYQWNASDRGHLQVNIDKETGKWKMDGIQK